MSPLDIRRRRVAALAVVAALVLVAPRCSAQDLDTARRLHRDGDLEAALAAYAAVVASGPPADAAIAHSNACVLLTDLGRYPEARQQCESALELARRLDDPHRLSRAHNNLGLVLQQSGALAEAAGHFRQALAINRERGDVEGQAINRANLGVVAILAGRYGEALAAQRGLAELARQHLEEPWGERQLRYALLNEGVVLEKLGAYREALDAFRAASDVQPPAEERLAAILQVHLGVAYRNLGDPVAALRLIERGAELFAQVGDLAGHSNALLNLGIVRHLNLRHLADAETDFRRALALARENGDRSEEIQDLFYLGTLLLDRGEAGAAGDAFGECLSAAEASGSREGRWSCLAGLARASEGRGDLDAAADSLRRSMAVIEEVRAGVDVPALRAGFFGDRRPVYEAAVRVLTALHRRRPAEGFDREAFQVTQRAKTRELVDLLRGQAGVPEALDLPQILAGWGARHLLELFVGDPDLHLWQIVDGRLRLSSTVPAAPILADVATVHQALAAGEAPAASTLARLAAALLPPEIAAMAAGDTLWIAADDRLRYLPFEILPDPAAPQQRLVERLSVAYLPSASTLAGRARGAAPSRRFVGLGAPTSQPPSAADSASRLLLTRFRLPELPFATQELEAARQQLDEPAPLLLGEAATEAAFRREVAAGARVVHLATHTVIAESLQRGAAILLSADGDDDGLLYPEEIAAVRNRSELTILASCSTVLGAERDGLAFAGLTGALLASGSAAVVATLWDVDDQVTAAFMQQLYYFLAQGLDSAAALRQAKRRMIADPRWNRPGLWAAYVLIGDAVAVLEPRRPWGRWAAAALALAAAGLLLWARRHRPDRHPS